MAGNSDVLDSAVLKLQRSLEAGELPPGEEGPARDTLRRYEERVRREGREPFSALYERWGEEAKELEGYFEPTPRVTEEQRLEIDDLTRNDEHPAEAEARIFNARQFAHDYNESDEEVGKNYPLYFLRFIHEEMGVRSATDGQVRGYLQGQYGVKKRASEAYTDAALKDVPFDEMVRAAVPELQKDPHWNPRKEGEITGLMREGHGYLSKKLEPYRGFIRNAVHSMQVHMGVMEGEARLGWDDLTEEMLNIPSKDRDLVLQAIVATGAPREDRKHWAQKLGENFWRGTVSFATGLPNDLTRNFLLQARARVDLLEVPLAEADPVRWSSNEVFSSTYRDMYAGEQHGAKEAADMIIGLFVDPPKKRRLTEEEKAKVRAEYDRMLDAMDIYRDLNDIADGTIDPARSEHAMVQGLYSFTRSLPQGLSMVLPYAWPAGIVMTYGQFAEDNNHRFRREQGNLSREQRHYLANAAAPWQTMASFLSDRLLLGRLPGFSAWLRQPVTTFATQLRRAPLMVPKGAVEFGSENLQDLTPYLVQEAVSRLSKDMPGVPWEMAMRGIRAGQEELAATVVWSTLVYHGAGSIVDVGAYRSQAARPVLMEAAGFSQEAASRISLAAKKGDWRGVEMMMRAEHDAGRIETNGENLVRQREAAAKLLREEAQRRGVAVAELEKIGALPVLSRVKDGRYQLAFDDGSFGYYATAQEAVTAMQDFAVHRGVRMTEDMREVFGKIQEDMKAGREVALQFSPETMTAQRAVKTGLATKKQMQERGQAGEALLANAVTGGTGTDPVHGNGGGEAASGVGSDADFGSTSLDTASDGVSGEGSSEGRVAEDGDYDATLHMAQAMAPEAADAEVAGQILGISRTAFKEGVARTTIRLYEGATPLTLIEEKLEGDASVMMRDPGKRAWLLEALRDVERKTGTTLFRTRDDAQVTDNDIKEAWSHLGQGYFVGRSKKGDDQMLGSWKQKGFRQVYADIMQSKAGPAMQAYGTFFRSVWRRGAELNQMRRAGTLDADLEGALRRSLGMDDGDSNTLSPTSTSLDGDGAIGPDARSLEANEGETSFAELPKQRQDKPESWEEVKRGHTWNSAKRFLPKLKDKRPGFAHKRGSWEKLVQGVAKWLGIMPKVTDPWGAQVTMANPQNRGNFADPLENRAAHLIGQDPNKTEDRFLDYEKLSWIGATTKTISDAQVRATNGTETFYFRSYAEGVHMVVVEDGAVKDQYSIVTQYAPELSKTEFEGALVEQVRPVAGLAPQGGPSAVGIPAQPQSQAVQTPQPRAQSNTTTDEAGSQSMSLLPEPGAARDRFLKSVGTPSEMDTDQERRMFEDFRDRVSNNVPGSVREYIERFGHVVDTDSARELDPVYSASRESRQKYSRATSPVASALAREVYDTLLEEAPPGDVLFNAGGPGSGKSRTLAGDDINAYAIVYDTVMADSKRAIEQIERALKKGHKITIRYIHQPLDAAVHNTIERAADPTNGRIVEAYAAARAHRAAQTAISEVAKHFESHPNVVVQAIDNTAFAAKPISLKQLQSMMYTESLEVLEKRAMETARKYFDEHRTRPEFTEALKGRVLRTPSQRKTR